MWATARPRLGPSFVDRHIAIVDPLLVARLLAEPLLAGLHHRLRGGRDVQSCASEKYGAARHRKTGFHAGTGSDAESA